MPDPSPTEAYIRECTQPEVAEKLREEWKRRGPQHGDWVHDTIGGDTFILLEASAFWLRNGLVGMPEGWIPLFTLRQLVGMLEERGYTGELHWGKKERKERYGVVISPVEGTIGLNDVKYKRGPDPETTLLRALVKVWQSDETPSKS